MEKGFNLEMAILEAVIGYMEENKGEEKITINFNKGKISNIRGKIRGKKIDFDLDFNDDDKKIVALGVRFVDSEEMHYFVNSIADVLVNAEIEHYLEENQGGLPKSERKWIWHRY